ncbi:MAG: hypothetical protein QGH45_14520 [Myxococcota bacterium]|nr:hypothetical protein [Myxococcota bacterium]
MKTTFIPVLLVGLFAAGCGATTKQYVTFPDQSVTIEDPNKARIYVYRDSILGSAIPFLVFENEDTPEEIAIGITGPNGYLCWEREPGALNLTSKAENEAELAIDLVAGAVYYVQQHATMGIMFARNVLELEPEEDARVDQEDCKPPKLELGGS